MRRPPLLGFAFSSSSFSQASNSGGSGGSFEIEVTGPGGGGTWLFALPDEFSNTDGTFMLSIADSRVLYVGRIDLGSLDDRLGSGDADAAAASIDWVEVDLASTGVSEITDHYHVYAFGKHWISFAAYDGTDATDTDLWLVKIDPLDVVIALARGAATVPPAAEVLVFSTTDSTALRYDASETYQTNDHFIVPVPTGIAVAIGHPTNASLRVITADRMLSSTAVGDVEFGDIRAFYDPMSPTGSAIASLEGDWKLLVPSSNSPATTQNELNLIETDAAFSAPTTTSSLTNTAYNFQMASFVELANRDLVVALNRVPTSGNYTSGETVVKDYGDIVLAIYNAADLSSEEQSAVIQSCSHAQLGARPHVSRLDRWLLTCWDRATYDSGTSLVSGQVCRLRVDLLSGTPW